MTNQKPSEGKILNIMYLVFILYIPISYCFAQDVSSVQIPKNNKGLAEYSEVINIDSTTKNELFLSALEWINKSYNSGKTVIQTADREGGMIIGNAISEDLIYNNSGIRKDGGNFSYTISIYCKDNRYKYVIDNITYKQGDMLLEPGANLAETFPSNWTGFLGNNKQTRREWKSFQFQADTYFRAIIALLKEHMKNSENQSDW